MNKFNARASEVNRWLSIIVFSLLVSACANEHNFSMGDSYLQVRDVQVLDPEASERNDGLVLSLEGNYGRQVMLNYRKSSENPTKAKELGTSMIIE
ncbi:hypothetical protein L1D32_03120 [Shewanella insulae]|nr:hypothetical protein [Shewanella insulae]MCG9714544.1 hypothetical protein [Shewanella insulae]MCG9737149.1 hypothetical protein [Shewanella insulae]MCG9756810.1 hypothetical protein [Shewanella insulae]